MLETEAKKNTCLIKHMGHLWVMVFMHQQLFATGTPDFEPGIVDGVNWAFSAF